MVTSCSETGDVSEELLVGVAGGVSCSACMGNHWFTRGRKGTGDSFLEVSGLGRLGGRLSVTGSRGEAVAVLWTPLASPMSVTTMRLMILAFRTQFEDSKLWWLSKRARYGLWSEAAASSNKHFQIDISAAVPDAAEKFKTPHTNSDWWGGLLRCE